jgi:uncharacterized membrane protein
VDGDWSPVSGSWTGSHRGSIVAGIRRFDPSELGGIQMIDSFIPALTLFAGLGCGLMAGVFFAFSVFVMEALARLPPAQGIAAMQSINAAVLNRWFLGVFFGTAALCVFVAIAVLLVWREPGAIYALSGSALYLAGVILVTIIFNVPMNNALAAVDPAGTDSAIRWTGYVARWTAWNHVRTVAAFSAAALSTISQS